MFALANREIEELWNENSPVVVVDRSLAEEGNPVEDRRIRLVARTGADHLVGLGSS